MLIFQSITLVRETGLLQTEKKNAFPSFHPHNPHVICCTTNMFVAVNISNHSILIQSMSNLSFKLGLKVKGILTSSNLNPAAVHHLCLSLLGFYQKGRSVCCGIWNPPAGNRGDNNGLTGLSGRLAAHDLNGTLCRTSLAFRPLHHPAFCGGEKTNTWI